MRHKALLLTVLLILAAGAAGAQVINRGAEPAPLPRPADPPAVLNRGALPPVVTGVRRPNARWYYEQAERYTRERRWELAERDLRRALELDDHYLDAALLLALVYRESGEPALAVARYEWAIRHGGDEARLRSLIGEIRLEQGDLLSAMAQYIVLRDMGSSRASDLWWRIERYVREKS